MFSTPPSGSFRVLSRLKWRLIPGASALGSKISDGHLSSGQPSSLQATLSLPASSLSCRLMGLRSATEVTAKQLILFRESARTNDGPNAAVQRPCMPVHPTLVRGCLQSCHRSELKSSSPCRSCCPTIQSKMQPHEGVTRPMLFLSHFELCRALLPS